MSSVPRHIRVSRDNTGKSRFCIAHAPFAHASLSLAVSLRALFALVFAIGLASGMSSAFASEAVPSSPSPAPRELVRYQIREGEQLAKILNAVGACPLWGKKG